MTGVLGSRRRELIEALSGYTAPPGERRAHGEMRTLAASRHDVLSADLFDPGHFTASAFVTDPEGQRLLLVHHRQLGRWLQPGGHIEPDDDSPLSAAMREVAEETGLEAFPADLRDHLPGGLFDIDVHPIPDNGTTPAHRHFDLRFHLIAENRPPSPSAEVLDAAWFDLDDPGGMADDPSVLRAAAKLRRTFSDGTW